MAGTGVTLIVDDSELSKFVTSTKKSERKAVRKACSAAIRPILRQARANVRKAGMRSLAGAVRGGAWKRDPGASVYIRGPQDYRAKGSNFYKLLFFEGGTATRYARKRHGKAMRRKASRGKIRAHGFFASAIATKASQGAQAFEATLKDWIEKQKT